MNQISKLEIAGNGAVEFFAQLRSLLPPTRHKIVIVPTRTQGSYLLVRPHKEVKSN